MRLGMTNPPYILEHLEVIPNFDINCVFYQLINADVFSSLGNRKDNEQFEDVFFLTLSSTKCI